MYDIIPQPQDEQEEWQEVTWLDHPIWACFRKSEWWFRASDVCETLGVNNSRQALTRLDEDEKDVISKYTPGGRQDVAVVNEAGLNNLIFSTRNRNPEIKAFKRFVFHDLLPALRERQFYIAPNIDAEHFAYLENAVEELKQEVFQLGLHNTLLKLRNGDLEDLLYIEAQRYEKTIDDTLTDDEKEDSDEE